METQKKIKVVLDELKVCEMDKAFLAYKADRNPAKVIELLSQVWHNKSVLIDMMDGGRENFSPQTDLRDYCAVYGFSAIFTAKSPCPRGSRGILDGIFCGVCLKYNDFFFEVETTRKPASFCQWMVDAHTGAAEICGEPL